ncbi:cation:proton antiporter [Pseudidiomarina sp.]|uniref:cation:proton antiporter n=1 Tax=Pseudidiomarina sp. TaxID=2081707 RepID=UPI00299E59D4|nr:cation:proton antiporter [Pseudidiomarina sp.]MDX1705727.1 cation:proton antiporter [Pseudidiomarina sp.]
MTVNLPQWLPLTFNHQVTTILLLGLILSLSMLADTIAKRTRIPRISLLVLLGLGIALVQQVVLGQQAGTLLGELSEPLIQLALVMVAFLLGSEFTIKRIRNLGPVILLVSLTVVFSGYLFVALGLLALGFPVLVAVALAAISVATDPAAVKESIEEDDTQGLTNKVLLGVVAVDDAWGIIIFGVSMAVLGLMISSDPAAGLIHAGWELGGAVLLGTIIGFPAAWLTGRLKPGKPILIEALALMLLLAGLSSLLGVSELLSSMFAGAVVANVSRHHTRSFKEIEHIEWPFLVFFFVLSGASIDLYQLDDALFLLTAYIALRVIGRLIGGLAAVRLPFSDQARKLPGDIGLALTPQAGVAIGMALLAVERFPDTSQLILPVVVASTVLFELTGPVLTRRVLR